MLIDNIISVANLENQKYRIFLCKMNGEILREITNQAFNVSYQVQLGATNIITFSVPSEYDGLPVQNYDALAGRNLLKLKKGETDIGMFEIQSAILNTDGIVESKDVSAYSLEIKFINKHFVLPNIEGGYKLVDNINPTQGILNLVTAKAPSWSIGTIDTELLPKVRIFDEVDTNVYEFLLGDVQKTYECMFDFDTINRRINAIYLPNYTRNTPVIISMENLGETASVTDTADQIVTRLHVYGQNDLTIRDVNLGQDFIDNFSYFKNTDFMTQNLIDALDNYDVWVATQRPLYEQKLTQYVTLNSELTILESDLEVLKGQLLALEKSLGYATAIQDSAQMSSLTISINNKNNEIDAKQIAVNTKQDAVNTKWSEIAAVVATLSVTLNFTVAQLKELDNFIIEDTYQDSSLLTTETMSMAQILTVQTELFNLGKNALNRSSVPRYTFSMDIVDFFQMKEFAPWWNEFFLGDLVKVKINDIFDVQVRVSGYTHNWSDNTLQVTFSNRYSLEDASVQLMELIQSGASAGTTIDYEKFKYKEYLNEQNEILNFINGSLDLSKNEVIGGTNQEIKLDSSGLLLRRYNSGTGMHEARQIKLTHNAIALTDDNFQTAKVAIGQLATGQYGIAAEVIAGKLIMGNNLQIENDAGSLVIDENGIQTNSFDLDMLSTNSLQNIIIDPNNGIQIRTRPTIGGAWKNLLSYNSGTNVLTFSGAIDWSQSNSPTATQVGARPYDWIPAYGDITGLKPPTNADNTAGYVGNKLTYIDSAGIYTGTLTANQINVISGIRLGAGAIIDWAAVNTPSASQVGARPDNWLPTIGQIGAKAYDWLPSYGDISGIKPPTNADNTAGYVGNKLTYIDANGIYTGTLTANQINVITGITLGSNATINWAQMNKPTAAQVGALPVGTYIPDVPSYITSTKITATTIESPTFKGQEIISECPAVGADLDPTGKGFLLKSSYNSQLLNFLRIYPYEGPNPTAVIRSSGDLYLYPEGGQVHVQNNLLVEGSFTVNGSHNIVAKFA